MKNTTAAAAESLNLASLDLVVDHPTDSIIADKRGAIDDDSQYDNLPLGVDFTGENITDSTAADTPLYEAQGLSQTFDFHDGEMSLNVVAATHEEKTDQKKSVKLSV